MQCTGPLLHHCLHGMSALCLFSHELMQGFPWALPWAFQDIPNCKHILGPDQENFFPRRVVQPQDRSSQRWGFPILGGFAAKTAPSQCWRHCCWEPAPGLDTSEGLFHPCFCDLPLTHTFPLSASRALPHRHCKAPSHPVSEQRFL